MLSGIVLSHADGRPMYLQIMEQIRRRIAVGDWKAGQPLPSIRQLAVDLQVSVITVKRAYLELEREGVIATQHGKGSVVASGADDRFTHPRAGTRQASRGRPCASAGLLGLGPRELQARLREAADRLTAAARNEA